MSVNKCELSVEFFWGLGIWDFFGKCAVSGVDFSPFTKAQNDKGFVILSAVKYPKNKSVNLRI